MKAIKKGLSPFLLIIIFTAAAYLPFISQAFHVDDTHFLYMARQIAVNWADPYGYRINWHGQTQPGYEIMANPPLLSYFLAVIIRLFSEKEIVVHAAMFIFPVILACSLVFLGRRFTDRPLIFALLFLSTPAYMVMSHTVMADIPALSFSLAATAFFIYGYDRQKPGLLLMAAVCAGAASLLKYAGLFCFVIFLLYHFLSPRRKNRLFILSLTGLLPFLLWCLYTDAQYGKPLLFILMDVPGRYTMSHKFMPLIKLFYMISSFGGAAVFPLALLAAYCRKKEAAPIFNASVIISLFAGLFAGLIFAYNFSQTILLICFLTGGFFCTLLILKGFYSELFTRSDPDARKGADRMFLSAWFALMLLFGCFFAVASVRVMLFLLAPALLLLFDMAGSAGLSKKFFTAAVIVTLSIGLLVSFSDYCQANIYRKIVKEDAANYISANRTVWFAGHWGFQYYMEKAGAKPLSNFDKRPKKGDIIFFSTLPWPQLITKDLKDRLKVRKKILSQCPLPLRTISRHGRAHFYSYVNYPWNIGFLPYSISSVPIEKIVITEVRASSGRQ